jgi:hypothetical protein
MKKTHKANPLFHEATPEVLRNKIFELAAMNYPPLVISIMLEGFHEPIRISERHIHDFIAMNMNGVDIWRKRLTKERVPTREELVRRLTDLLSIRFKRAVNDFKAFETLSERRRTDDIHEEEYQRQLATLYLPTSIELINLANAIDRKLMVPASAGTVEPTENQQAEPEIDEERKAAIQEAIDKGDMIKAQELMYAPAKEAIPSQE